MSQNSDGQARKFDDAGWEGVADAWQGKETDNRFAAMFGGTHTSYWDVDIFDPGAEVVATVGNTTYVLVP